MSKNILYTPSIDYKKNYYTEGTFEENSVEDSSSQISSDISTSDIIQNLINSIDNNLKWIPRTIKETYLSPYIAMKDEYNKLPSDIINPNSDPDPSIIDGTIKDDDNPDDDFPTDIFAKGPDIYIDIKDKLAERSNIASVQYATDFIDIYKDYLEKINISTQNYIYSTLSILNMTDQNHNLKSYYTADIKNPNLIHLSDYLIKSNIVFDQTIRLHKKLFDMDATILHIRGIKLSEKLIERYFAIENIDNNNNDLALNSNILLSESKKVADKKYKENFYSLYKYLNSSVILMDESIQIMLKQNKSALAINKYEVRE